MMPDVRTITAVLQRFDLILTATRIDACGGGFSGAKVWQIAAGGKEFALRAWPCESNAAADLRCQRAIAIHSVMRQLNGAGLAFVPQPRENEAGDTLLFEANHAWELFAWLPGEASYHRDPASQPAKLRAAMTALAHWHLAAAKIEPPAALAKTQHWQTSLAGATRMIAVACDAPRFSTSPGLKQRLARLAEIHQQLLPKLRMAKIPPAWPELYELAPRLMEEFQRAVPRVEPLLTKGMGMQIPLQLCLRDIWHEHVLYVGDSVSGLIDYEAMRVESVAGDLARLSGSLLGKSWHEDRAGWQRAIESYETIRPLNDAERSLLPAFDCSTVAISGMNWLDWIIAQERTFSDRAAVLARLRENLARLVAMNAISPREFS